MRVTTISLVGLLLLIVTSTASAQGGIPWVYNLGEAQQMAQRDRRLLLLHFYADWCGPCRSLEQSVFPDANVGRTLAASYVPVKINVDKDKELAKRYGVTQIPMDVIADSQGRVLYQTNSPSNPIQYVQLLNSLVAGGAANAPVHSVSTQVPQQDNQSTLPRQTAWDSPWLGQSQLGNGGTPSSSYAGQAGQQGSWGQSSWQPNQAGAAANEAATTANQAAASAAQTMNPAPLNAGGQTTNPYANSPADPGPAGPTSLLGADGRQGTWGQTPSYTENPMATAQAAPAGANQQPTAPPKPAGAAFDNPHAQPGNAPVAPPANPNLVSGPPLALDGFCPVTLAEEEKWEKGNPAWGALHRGRTYLFQGQQQQQLFLADPDRYSPVLSGYDPTRYVDAGEPVPGLRQHGMWFRGKIYLFANEGTLDQFARNPEHYAQRSHEIMMAAGR